MQKAGKGSRRGLQASKALTPSRRLRNRFQFLRFFEGSEKISLPECVVYRIKNDQGHFRLGITIKARGSSVDRNRVKRVVREEIRRQCSTLGPFDYNVVIPNSKQMDWKYAKRLSHSLKFDLLSRTLKKAE